MDRSVWTPYCVSIFPEWALSFTPVASQYTTLENAFAVCPSLKSVDTTRGILHGFDALDDARAREVADTYYDLWNPVYRGLVQTDGLQSAEPLFFPWRGFLDASVKGSPCPRFEEAGALMMCAVARLRAATRASFDRDQPWILHSGPNDAIRKIAVDAKRWFGEAAILLHEVQQVKVGWTDLVDHESPTTCNQFAQKMPTALARHAEAAVQASFLFLFLTIHEANIHDVCLANIRSLASGTISLLEEGLRNLERVFADQWRLHVRKCIAFFRLLRAMAIIGLADKEIDQYKPAIQAARDATLAIQYAGLPACDWLADSEKRLVNTMAKIHGGADFRGTTARELARVEDEMRIMESEVEKPLFLTKARSKKPYVF